jgi:hypothetical protein
MRQSSNVPLQEMPSWSPERASTHALSRTKYSGAKAWKGTERQVFALVESDFLYNARAFHHVVPGNPLSAEAAQVHMQESWRTADTKMDLGFFVCKVCRQYAKHKFCTEVKYSARYVHKHRSDTSLT